MPRFLCLQRKLPGDPAAKKSPTEMQAMYAQFAAWQAQFSESLVDIGGQLGAGRLVTPEPVTDGPFIEVKELAGGYMIVRAATLDDAIVVARACPGLVGPGSGVEVLEIRGP